MGRWTNIRRVKKGRAGRGGKEKTEGGNDSMVNSMETRVNSFLLTAVTVAMNGCFVHHSPLRGPAHVSYSVLGLKSHYYAATVNTKTHRDKNIQCFSFISKCADFAYCL